MKDHFKEELYFLRSLIQNLTNFDTPLSEKMEKSLNLILNKIKATQGSIMLVDDKKNNFTVVASTNKKILNRKISVDPKSIAGHVLITGEPLYFKDVKKSPKFRCRAHLKNYCTPSFICMPLKTRKGIIGVINVSDHQDQKPFTNRHFEILKDYAYILSPLLENSCLLHKLEEEKKRNEKMLQELKISKEELMITYTERSELVQMVVHDFKSPLSAIISNLDVLLYMGLSEEHKSIVESALKGANKLLEMINEFLELARIDEFQSNNLTFRPTSLLPIIREVVEEFLPQAETKNISITYPSTEDINIWGHETLVRHLFQNLISNAVKYTPEGGTVNIYWKITPAKRAEDKFDKIAIICVEDTGCGIPDKYKETIFRRFSRLKRHSGIQGSGIGLFICRRIATLLGGKIWVEDRKGGGSIFCVSCYLWEENNARQRTDHTSGR